MSPRKHDFNHLPTWIPTQVKRVGITMEKLSQRAGVSRAAIYAWMIDANRPTTQTMARICHTLGVDLEEGLRQYTEKRRGRPPGKS